MAGTKNHEYHILPPDIIPLVTTISIFMSTSGLALAMHSISPGKYVFALGIILLLSSLFNWFSKIVREANAGDHTPIVQLHQRYGMILFITSEVMFFLGWFWAFFDFSLFPSAEAEVVGGVWPPKGIEAVINAFDLPLINTLILLCSGTTLTWAHRCLLNGNREGLRKGLWATVLLGLVFLAIQIFEYSHAPFAFGENTYGSIFYMATGFHGFHVAVGAVMLIVCLVRSYGDAFTPRQHFGFESAAWYWHFVDVVWLFLFVAIYVWGNWGAVTE